MSTAGIPTTALTHPSIIWEYHVVHVNIDSFFFGPDIDPEYLRHTLDAAGKDGWELVNTVNINQGHGRTSDLVFLFKRPYRSNRSAQSSSSGEYEGSTGL